MGEQVRARNKIREFLEKGLIDERVMKAKEWLVVVIDKYSIVSSEFPYIWVHSIPYGDENYDGFCPNYKHTENINDKNDMEISRLMPLEFNNIDVITKLIDYANQEGFTLTYKSVNEIYIKLKSTGH